MSSKASSATRSTRSARPTRPARPSQSDKPRRATRSAPKSTISKTVVAQFKKQVSAELQPIETLDLYKQQHGMFTLEEGLVFGGYCWSSDGKNLIFVSVIKGDLDDPAHYHELLVSSDLYSSDLCCSTSMTYWLIYKNLKKCCCLSYDYANDAEDIEIEENFKLESLKSIFTDSSVNDPLTAYSSIKRLADKLYAGYSLSPKNRFLFLTLIYTLIENRSIPFIRCNDIDVNLMDYLEIADVYNTNEEDCDEFDKQIIAHVTTQLTNQADDPNWEHPLYHAFKSVVEDKISNNADKVDKKVLDRFKTILDQLSTDRTKKYGMALAYDIYDKIYKPFIAGGNHIDMANLAFAMETKNLDRSLGKSRNQEGQTFTPQMTKDLIIEIIGSTIENSDRCYDPTCGTGGFAYQFCQYCEKHGIEDTSADGCELEPNLAEIALIQRLCSPSKGWVYTDNCFSPKVKKEIGVNSVDYLLMNPPFLGSKSVFIDDTCDSFDWHENPDHLAHTKKGKGYKNDELTFCRYNMEFLKEGGWFAFVVPISTVAREDKKNSQRYEHKKRLIETSEIWLVIKMNKDIFTNTDVSVCVIVGRKVGTRTPEQISTWKTKCVDFTEDGGYKKMHVDERLYNAEQLAAFKKAKIFDFKELDGIHDTDKILTCFGEEPDPIGSSYYHEQVLTPEMNWVFTKYEFLSAAQQVKVNRLAMLQREFEIRRAEIEAHDWENEYGEENEGVEWRETKIIPDLGKLIEFPNGATKYNVTEVTHKTRTDGFTIPYYSMRKGNGGLVGYVSDAAINRPGTYLLLGHYASGENNYCCFIISPPFNYDSVHTIIIRMNDEKHKLSREDWQRIADLIGMKFSKMFNYSENVNAKNIKEQVVDLPYDVETDELAPSKTKMFSGSDGCMRYRDVPVLEVFDLISSVETVKSCDAKPGEYPMINNGEQYNGVFRYVDMYTYEGDDYITFATTGKTGFCAVQQGKFCLYSEHPPGLLKLKPSYSYLKPALWDISRLMTNYFTVKYNYSTKLSNSVMKTEIIPHVPFVDDLKNPGHEIIDVSTIMLNTFRVPLHYHIPLTNDKQKQNKQADVFSKMKSSNSTANTTASTTANATAANSSDDEEPLDDYVENLVSESHKRKIENEENQKRRKQAEQLKQLNRK